MAKLFRMTAAALAVFLTGAAQAAAETPHKYDFEVTWSILPELTLATGSIAIEDNGVAYRMGMEARALLAVPPVDWRGFFATEGKLSANGRSPELFKRRSQTKTRSEEATIVWSEEGGAPQTSIEETPSVGLGETVDPSEVEPDAVDPLTFLAMIMDQVEETNGDSCNLVVTTWDGVRLATLEATTGEKVQARRVNCRIKYLSIRGLPDVQSFVAREGATTRIVRFEKKLGQWRPIWITIDGEFAGVRSTFTTTISPAE